MASSFTLTKFAEARKRERPYFFRVAHARNRRASFSRRRHRSFFMQRPGAGNGRNDLPSVETPVFDEDFRGVPAADDHSRKVNARDVAFERLRIASGAARFRIEANSLPFEKFEIGMISGHGKDVKRRDGFFRRAILHEDPAR